MGSFLQPANASGGASSGGGIGASLAFSPGTGVIDPTIAGFVASAGSTGTVRLKVTLAGNTTFEGLPAGADGQQLYIIVVSGNFLLTLSHLNGATAQKQIVSSRDLSYALDDTAQLFYDSGLGAWVLVG